LRALHRKPYIFSNLPACPKVILFLLSVTPGPQKPQANLGKFILYTK